MLYAARSHVGMIRHMNQDEYRVHADFQPFQLIVVADGMGGASAGEVASKIAVESVCSVVRENLARSGTDPAQVLRDAVVAANGRIWECAESTANYRGMGTTLVSTLSNRDKVIFAHVGDSRGYLFKERQLRQVTSDHSLVGELVRRGQLTAAEAQHHPQRNIVTRSLGTLENHYPDIVEETWTRGDVLLLCTDGLSNVLTIEELTDEIKRATEARSEDELGRIADSLLRTVLERGGPDNVTLVLVVNREEREEAC